MTNAEANSITFYSTSTCGDCRRSKRLLDSLGVAYDLIDIENDEQAAFHVMELNNGMQSVPVIKFRDGTHLTEPSDLELTAKLKELALI